MLNDDAVKELDRDVAHQFLEMHGIKLDLKPAIKKPQVQEEHPLQDQTSATTNTQKKSVSFKAMNALESEDYQQSVS